MSILQYLKDKRYFIYFYIILMTFISLMVIISISETSIVSNLIYINLVSFCFACIYVLIGYFFRNSYYRKLSSLVTSGNEEMLAAMPEPQTFQQKQYLELLKQLHNDHTRHIQKLQDEKRDHQDYIMSWIHEVKLPIAAGRLLIENSSGKTVDYLVDNFEDELQKIDKYIEQALYYSRIDSFSKDYFINEIELSQVIRESIKKYSKLFINKRIRLTMFEESQLVQSDRKWISFIIDQLITNALKYTDEGGEVSIRFEENQKEKRLLIRDTGIGIKPEDINRVFEKGFTGSTGRNHTKSTGMGLYLAKQMAQKLGHDLSIESVEGEFTKVTIYFPKNRSYIHF
ncbi:sensor histidine kinase [Alkalihalobacillus sp. AL-G]|uniref:sensor histidine kinase n=1 Tax=Alkalihalobacillus sp. AL-G TaxID=2926399 RepID=UPI00272AE942|nr:sensor histidine kinase [Alkalihalobacillus sp. AL-G]WLD94330.1 sensor histidine kinase [Alkalihalobacillus sp. AL-G]